MQREVLDELVDLDDLPTKRRVLIAVGRLHGLYEFNVEPRRNTRSTRQNRYLFGVIYRSFRDFMRQQGQEVSTDEAHQYIKGRFGFRRELVNPLTGEVMGDVLRSSTTYDVAEMREYIDRVITWLADTFGIVVPDPASYGIERAA